MALHATNLRLNETPRGKQRGIFLHAKIYFVASHGEFNPRTRLKNLCSLTEGKPNGITPANRKLPGQLISLASVRA